MFVRFGKGLACFRWDFLGYNNNYGVLFFGNLKQVYFCFRIEVFEDTWSREYTGFISSFFHVGCFMKSVFHISIYVM